MLNLTFPMGTPHDWSSAVFWGMFWAGGMLLWETLSNSDRHIKPMLSVANIISLSFGGIAVGVGTTFRWEAFHWPVVLVIVGALLSCVFFARLANRTRGTKE